MNEQDFNGVIMWIRTHEPEQVQEFLYHVLLKGAELTLNALLTPDDPGWDQHFDAIAEAVEGTSLLIETVHRAIEATEEPFADPALNPFRPHA